MAGLESTAAFSERALTIGLDSDFLKKMTDKGLDTYGKLAFVCSCKPASGDDAPLFKAVKDLIGEDVPAKEHMVLRRLWFEAHSHALVDLESRASRSGDSSPRELPLAERMARLKRQRAELKGLELDVKTEPGHALVDRIQAMLDASQIVHVPPEKCISREDEINGTKSESKLALSADGSIKITKQAADLRCETSGELRLRHCYLRRALAFDQIGLASFVEQERWHNRLFHALTDTPPNGYRYVSVQQVLAADQRLWHIVSQESRGNLTIGAGLPAPLDTYIAAASKNPLVIACITPLPKPADAVPHTPGLPKGPKGKGNQGKGGKDQKGKGKGRNTVQQGSDAAPTKTSLKELLDNLPNNCVRATEEGRFLCPFYNQGICRFQKRKSCRFGRHACYYKGCLAERPYIECKH